MGVSTYCAVFNTKDTGPYNILVDGKSRYSNLTETQANFYWAGLNIFNGHTAALKLGKKVLARKGGA